jgi:hypothetical protein
VLAAPEAEDPVPVLAIGRKAENPDVLVFAIEGREENPVTVLVGAAAAVLDVSVAIAVLAGVAVLEDPVDAAVVVLPSLRTATECCLLFPLPHHRSRSACIRTTSS